MSRSLNEVIGYLNGVVGQSVDANCGELQGECVSLIKGLMNFLGVPDPYGPRGNAKDLPNYYIPQGIARNGSGMLNILVNANGGNGSGHVWVKFGNDIWQQNYNYQRYVSKNTPQDPVTNIMNFDQWLNIINVPSESGAVYRLYNPTTRMHLWSSSQNETYTLVNGSGWNYEGIAWHSPASGVDVHRMYNPTTTEYMLSSSASEISGLVNSGWRDNGVTFHGGGSRSVFRLYKDGLHLWTADGNEKQTLIYSGWKDEGVPFYAQS